jgi:putative membrane-bound dehydrogenase-like protein
MKNPLLFCSAALLGAAISLTAADKKILLIAGKPSHPPGMHEFNAGSLLLKKCLDKVPGIKAEVHNMGWPKDDSAFDGVSAVLIYADGGGGHPALQGNHLQFIAGLLKKGVGLGCAHYGVEVPKDKGGPEFQDWIGGYYENAYSVNPIWSPDFSSFPKHPITRGVKPFTISDEWYFNMRWRPDMKGVTPILVAKPSDTVRKGPYVAPKGPYDHIVAASGREEAMMWAVERPDGGRGFGFTGGHFHKNWGNDNFRKVMLNALLWLAKVEVPSDGVASSVSEEELAANLDTKPAPRAPKSAEVTPAPTAVPTVAVVAAVSGARNATLTETPRRSARARAAEQGSAGRSGPQAAKAYMNTFAIADGLEATLFAAEPMVVNPADMDVDSKGRVWITEGANYRITKRMNKPWGEQRPGGDRIIILEDTDRDGAADKVKVFYQDPTVNAALGVCILGNRVIVSSSPYVFVLTDTNGDDVADKRELFFEDTSQGDHDHCTHAFVFGPDGKLYFNFGNEVRELRRPKSLREIPLHGPVPAHESEAVTDLAGNAVSGGGKPYRQGMVFRCNLDGSDVECLGFNFRNNYEVAVDSFGTLWQSDNDDDGNRGVRINYVMEFGNYGYTDELTGAGWKTKRANLEAEIPKQHWHQNDPGVIPNLLFTGAGSPTGMCLYEGKLLPEQFRNQMIHTDAGPRVVRAYPVQPDGAGYKAEIADILTCPDSWFRPSDVCVGPDGSLYVADWNDAGVGGHNMADRQLDTMTGRVYRVAPKGNKPSVPKLDLKSADGCVAALQSPNLATRYLAWTELNRMQARAEKDLLKLWKSTDPRMRARALHLLARIRGSERKYIETALKDSDADIRITGLRIARERKLDVIPYVKQLASDASAAVRRESIIALRLNTSPDMPKLWAELAQQHDGKDRWYVEALGIGAQRRESECLAAWLQVAGAQWNTPAGRDIIWRSRGANAADYLVKILLDKNTQADDKPRYVRALDFIPKSPEKDKALADLALGALQ